MNQAGIDMSEGYKEGVSPWEQEILLQTQLRRILQLFCHYVKGEIKGIGRTS